MEIITRYILDRCEIETTWKTISIRSKIQRWVVNGAEEMLIEPEAGFHRNVLEPGDWDGASLWGVTDYAAVAWTEQAVSDWNTRLASLMVTANIVNPVPEP